MDRDRFQQIFLLILVVAVTALFVTMIRPFMITILLAGIIAALAQPLRRWLLSRVRRRERTASLLTLLILIAVVLLPLLGFLGIVAAQAVRVGESALPWIQTQLEDPNALDDALARVPWLERIVPERDVLLERGGELVASTSTFLVEQLAAATRGTVNFLFQLAILIVTTFVFLGRGQNLLRRILYYLPLEDEDEQRLLDRFTSITRATLKGTFLIGVLQGVAAGAAFAAVGIEGAVFWGAVMIVLSVVPGIGTGLVWIPAAIVLAVSGRIGAAIGLAAWCGLVVGSIDNVLRPRLVGRDTALPDLLILFSTIGGMMTFGVLGFVLGPILAGVFVTVWEIYGTAFRDVLPPVKQKTVD